MCSRYGLAMKGAVGFADRGLDETSLQGPGNAGGGIR